MKTILATNILMWIMILPFFGKAQLITITGNVKDSLSGEALENVSIFETFSKVGTISSRNGYFKLILSSGERNLKISYAGYIDILQPIVLKNDTTLSIRLEPLTPNKGKLKKHIEIHADSSSK